ncbi:MAG: CRISPR-associated endonuclease Cas1 [Firmicutes bacterium]|nr:CRISPR-associated endonuclease Cas1 [Bacillota bacterium]
MSYVYVTEQGAALSVDGGYMVVKYKDGMEHKIPKETVESVAVFGNISITTPCSRYLLEKRIPVSFFSERGAYFGKLVSTRATNIFRLKKQIYASEDEEFSFAMAKKIIKAKINNQIVVLRRYTEKRRDLDHFFIRMKATLGSVEEASSYNELIGYEGKAAKDYFSVLSQIINDDFKFKGRTRMPPKDPFNSMISLGYTLLMYEIYGEIENKGLTPYCGFLHKDHERHPTLASDLMEEWRAVIVDSVVLSLIQGKEIKIDEFTKDIDSGGVFLQKEAMKKFVTKYEKRLRTENKYLNGIAMSYRKCLWYQANAFTNAVENRDVDLYEPVRIR